MTKQHSTPCHDCPWRKKLAIPTWLGDLSAEDWVRLAHGEGIAMCHTKSVADDIAVDPQCAGLAIYRSNVCKSVRDPDALKLPADRENVFTSRAEFLEYHSKENMKEWLKIKVVE